jgi:AAA15 family ATPase/GTPase
MLIEFNVANFRSICDRQTFSLACANTREHQNTNAFEVSVANKFRLLRSAAIYGPNAGGKTNVLLGLKAMMDTVLESATQKSVGDELDMEPFALCSDAKKKPSEFEVTFIANGIRFQYGFSATKKRIYEEWLLAYPNGKAQHWFSRTWDDHRQEYHWDMGYSLSGEKQIWIKSTRHNALFLSTAINLNSDQLLPVYNWFKRTLRVANSVSWSSQFSASIIERGNGDGKNKILDFLQAADLDIHDIEVEERKFDPASLSGEVSDEVRNMLEEHTYYEVRTFHKDRAGNAVAFDLDEESAGTQKLFSYAGPWFDTLENGYVLFVDELHAHLHPKLVNFLVELFHNEKTNPNNAQLVFTTHETSVLSQEIFRRDQIWFCEKDDTKATHVTPLTDYHPRKGRENLEAAYLSGRYGAVPYVKSLKYFSKLKP